MTDVLDIKTLHKEDLIKLVEHLQKEEPGMIADYFKSAPPVTIQLAVEWLHATLCQESHPPCQYYEEDGLAHAWIMPQHATWREVFFDIALNCGITTEDFLSCVGGFRYLAGEADRRKKAFNPNLGPFLESIFRLRPDALLPTNRIASYPEQHPLSEDSSTETESESLELSEPAQ